MICKSKIKKRLEGNFVQDLEPNDKLKILINQKAPFGRQVVTQLEPSSNKIWTQKGVLASQASRNIGNIYTGSLYLNLLSYLASVGKITQEKESSFFLMEAESQAQCLQQD